jgi:hypothetical protein
MRPNIEVVVCIQMAEATTAQVAAWRQLWQQQLADCPTNTKALDADTSKALGVITDDSGRAL